MEMTENEAIKELHKIRPIGGIIPQKRAEAIDVAINALEKQIPKKPHKNFEKFSGVWCSCGKYLGKGYFVEKTSFCSDCGQKLDWSDEE